MILDMRLDKLRHDIILFLLIYINIYLYFNMQFSEDISKQNYLLSFLHPLLSLSSATVLSIDIIVNIFDLNSFEYYNKFRHRRLHYNFYGN